MRSAILLFILMILAAPCASMVNASPNAATWHSERLLGENGRYYFLLVTEWINKGSYYQHTEVQRIHKVDKLTDSTVAVTDIRRVLSTNHVEREEQELREQSLPNFNLSAFLRSNGILHPYPMRDYYRAQLDSTGLYFVLSGRKIPLLSLSELKERTPTRDLPREVVGVEFTSVWPDSGVERMVYYTLRTHAAGGDIDAADVVVAVPRRKLSPPQE
jgi:hypothetical protein